MRYPVTLTPAEEGGYVVTFPDVPEAITQGDTWEQAMENARDALLTAMEFYVEDSRPMSPPSPILEGQPFVAIPPGMPLHY